MLYGHNIVDPVYGNNEPSSEYIIDAGNPIKIETMSMHMMTTSGPPACTDSSIPYEPAHIRQYEMTISLHTPIDFEAYCCLSKRSLLFFIWCVRVKSMHTTDIIIFSHL